MSALNKLGIRYGRSEASGRMGCLCVFHADRNLGNAWIWLDKGRFKCFTCGKSTDIIGIIRHVKNCSFPEAVRFLGLEYQAPDRFDRSLEKRQPKEPGVEKDEDEYELPELTVTDLHPEKYLYTKMRGYDKTFIHKFKVYECTAFPYRDYLVLPIGETFEARKLKEAEKLYEYYSLKGEPTREGFSRIKRKFSLEVKSRKLRFSKGKLWENGEQLKDPRLYYLLRPKVLYPAKINPKETLFNLESLNLDEDVYISEGTGSLPKMTKVYNNCTCVFGVALNETQFDLLKTFKKRKIIIPNDDDASVNFIWELCQRMSNVWVLYTNLDDIDDGFEDVLRKCELIEGSRYVLRKRGVLPTL